MKSLPSLALIAAFSAFAILPVSLPVAVSVFVTAGILSILISDYSRPMTWIQVAPVPARRSERLRLAA